VVRELQSLWQLEEAGPVCSEKDEYKGANQTDQSLAIKKNLVI
jgi:hypothetical protein